LPERNLPYSTNNYTEYLIESDPTLSGPIAKKWSEAAKNVPESERDWRWLEFLIRPLLTTNRLVRTWTCWKFGHLVLVGCNAKLAVYKKEKPALRKNKNDHSTNRANREINLEWAGRESHSNRARIIPGVVSGRLQVGTLAGMGQH